MCKIFMARLLAFLRFSSRSLGTLALLATAFAAVAADAQPAVPKGYRLVYQQDFKDASALRDFAFSDANAWKHSPDEGGALELAQQSKYKPTVRSPFNIALIADQRFGDFILEAEVTQTGREYGHRDMCFYFGFEDPARFYYAHLATAPDDHAHNLFIVNNAPRVKFAREVSSGVNWGLNIWHKVRIERALADGTIRVFFDDMTTPVLVGEEKTFGTGYVGFGSFDDTGKVRKVKIWSRNAEKEPAAFFDRAGATSR